MTQKRDRRRRGAKARELPAAQTATLRRSALDAQRSTIAFRQRRLERSCHSLTRLIKNKWRGTTDIRQRLILVSHALDYFVVDKNMAVSYVPVRVASQDRRIPQDLRKELKALHRAAWNEIQDYARPELSRGRRPQLTRRQEDQASGAYVVLLQFFQDPTKRPKPERPKDRELLADINRQLQPFAVTEPIQPSELEELSYETSPSRIAKLAVAFAFDVRVGTVDKILTRRRSRRPTRVKPPANRRNSNKISS